MKEELTQRRIGEAQRITEKILQINESFVILSVTFVSFVVKRNNK